MASALPSRFNLRDLGGLPTAGGCSVRPGLLFRGASLHRLEPDQLPHLDRLGIQVAVDLRTSRERAKGVFAAPGVEVVGLPLFEVAPAFDPELTDAVGALAGTYLWMLEEGRDSIARIFELLVDPGSYPVVVYCAAGKDRTGVVCALVLRLIGVSTDTVVADYVLSDAPARSLRAWHQAQDPARRDPNPAALYAAPGEAMHRFLDAVDGIYGSVDGYLAQIGVPVAETRASLGGRLVKPSR